MKRMIFCILMLSAGSLLQAQPGRTIALPEDADYIRVVDGDTLVVRQPALYVFSQSGYEKLTGAEIKQDTLASLYRLNRTINDSLLMLKDSVIVRLNNIVDIQTTAYDSLMRSFNRAALLVDKSTANTDRALSHIRTLKMMSYVSGTVMGGVAGGMVGGQLQDSDQLSFSWTGAAVGAVTGFVINRYLLNLF